MATLDAQLNAALVAVGSADGLSAGRREAEEFLLAAQSTWPVSSARFFAQWMADSSKEPTTRQVAALLLKNVLEPVVGARPLSGEWLDYGEEVRKEMHNACWLALLDADPKLRRLAALCTARMGCWEIPQGRWPELLPELQRWAESGSKRHCHASLHTLRCLAEDGASLGVQAQLALLRTCGAQLLSCATEEACWAAEAMFAMLGWLRGADDLLRNQVVEALLVAHLAADARLAQEDAYAKELCSCILRCWGRLATESPILLAEHMSQISALLLAALHSKHLELAILAVEFWSSLALQDLAIGRGDAYAGDGLVEPSQLIPALLALLQSSGESEDSEALEDSIKICLAFSVQLEDSELGIQQLTLFVQQQLQGAAGAARAALAAWEALMEAPSAAASTALLHSQLCHVLHLLASQPPPALQRQALLTCAAVLRRQGHEVPEECKEMLLHLSLHCLRASAAASAAAALLRPLLSGSAAAPGPFEALAQRLLALAEVPGAARTELLESLSQLISGASAECLSCFQRLLATLRAAKNVEGLGGCVKALTLRLGPLLPAEEMMQWYLAYEEELLPAAGHLPVAPDVAQRFWDAVVRQLEETRPEVCKATLQILLDLNISVLSSLDHHVWSTLLPRLLRLAEPSAQGRELSPLALRCLGALAAANRTQRHVPELLKTWMRLGRAAAEGSAIRRSTCFQRVQDVQMLQLDMFTAVLRCFVLFFDGLQQGFLVAIEQLLPDILTFVADCLRRRPTKQTMLCCLEVLAVVVPSYPSGLEVFAQKLSDKMVEGLAEMAAKSPEPKIQDLEKMLQLLSDQRSGRRYENIIP